MKYMKALAGVFVLVLIDRLTKNLAVTHLMGQEPIPIIRGVFELYYLENQGMAFGLLQEQRVFFIIVTVLTLGAITFCYYRIPDTKKYIPLKVVTIFICAGAVGNFIDRMVNGFVVDFFYFKLIDFPVFNMADIYVTGSGIILFVLVLFYYKGENDFDFLSFKKKNTEV